MAKQMTNIQRNDAMWAAHAMLDAVKQSIMHDFFVTNEWTSADALAALTDITIAVEWLRAEYQREHRREVERRLAREQDGGAGERAALSEFAADDDD